MPDHSDPSDAPAGAVSPSTDTVADVVPITPARLGRPARREGGPRPTLPVAGGLPDGGAQADQASGRPRGSGRRLRRPELPPVTPDPAARWRSLRTSGFSRFASPSLRSGGARSRRVESGPVGAAIVLIVLALAVGLAAIRLAAERGPRAISPETPTAPSMATQEATPARVPTEAPGRPRGHPARRRQVSLRPGRCRFLLPQGIPMPTPYRLPLPAQPATVLFLNGRGALSRSAHVIPGGGYVPGSRAGKARA